MGASDLQDLLTRACDAVRPEVGIGRVADYIPALASVEPGKFGAAVVTIDGKTATYGDAGEAFSIQSISKVFSLALALNAVDMRVWDRVGREPSGSPFNSIVQLETERGIPRNPFINAGAIVICDLLLQHFAEAPGAAGRAVESSKHELLTFIRRLADDSSIRMDADVAASEIETSHRNASLAHFMHAFGNLHRPVAEVLDVYCHQCAIAMSCTQLARAGLFLANHGRDPLSGAVVVGAERARRINALMMLCGHYDASGEFAFRAGIPGKSGVGGGILAIVPNKAAIAVWSPCLNRNGNSHAGTAAMTAIANSAGWQAL